MDFIEKCGNEAVKHEGSGAQEAERIGRCLWCQVEMSNEVTRGESSELTLGDSLRGDCSIACFLVGVPS